MIDPQVPTTADAAWQFLGRLHPMVLHLPIGLLAGLVTIELVELSRGRPLDRSVRATLSWLLAGSAVVSMITGLVLANEGGYGDDALARHRLLGIVFAVIATLLAFLQRRQRQRALYVAGLVACCGLALPVGHIGAGMTHGEDFLTAPFRTASREVAAPTDDEFTRVVLPVFDAKCVTCHGPSKRKGKLRLDSGQAILAGGSEGPAVVPGDPAQSLLLQRIRLPLDDDEHMPPSDHPQLTPKEIEVLESWIASGAKFGGAAATPSAVAAADEPPPPAPKPLGPSAGSIRILLDAQIHAEIVDPEMQLLWVDAGAARDLDDTALAHLLESVAPHIVTLSVSGTKAADATIAAIAKMPKLERLDLSGTAVTGIALERLRDVPSLATLNITRLPLNDGIIDALASMPSLAVVHAWRSGLSAEGARTLSERRPSLIIDLGDVAAAAPAETEPPPAFSSDAPLPVPSTGLTLADALKPSNTACPISGAPIDPRFVIVHDGKVIGFCCEKCVAQFYAKLLGTAPQ
ncbi:MAG: hypothetical protein JNM94_15925 [Phycisphaerae bacterium]|nr:hypothetical protein [Phycisphaerae bacterium]